jgi:hypothetical protein
MMIAARQCFSELHLAANPAFFSMVKEEPAQFAVSGKDQSLSVRIRCRSSACLHIDLREIAADMLGEFSGFSRRNPSPVPNTRRDMV